MKIPALLLSLWLIAIPALAQPADPPLSIYQLDAELTNQSGMRVGLDAHRGHPVLVTLFYGSCPMTCPMLIDTLRAIERAASAPQRANLRILMISIDPQRDTPDKLLALAKTRRLDLSRWTLAQANAADVRKIAALLNVQYRHLPDGNYNHSNVITLLSPQGEIVRQSSLLGQVDEALTRALPDVAAR